MSEAKNILTTLMPDLDEDLIEAWIDKLIRAKRDPMVYANAFLAKSKKLDRGCDGFFVAMHRQNKEDEWIGSQLKVARQKALKVVRSEWPYPPGKNGCSACYGQGWYSISVNKLDDAHAAAYDHQQDDGFEVALTKSQFGTDRAVFICRECNPRGAMIDKFQTVTYPTYPVFGAPFSL